LATWIKLDISSGIAPRWNGAADVDVVAKLTPNNTSAAKVTVLMTFVLSLLKDDHSYSDRMLYDG